VAESLTTQFERYFGQDYKGFWVFLVAQFLDPRTNHLLSFIQKQEAIKFIKLLCTVEEITLPHKQKKKKADMTPDERLLADLGEQPSDKCSPIDAELRVFITLMLSENKTKEPLEFWTVHGSSMEILLRIVRRVFPISPCSTDVERFFSTTGFICADHRGRLAPNTVNMLDSMNSWLRRDLGYDRSKRQQKSSANSARFTALNTELNFILGMEAEDDDSDNEI
jgi:hypothetical protein